MKGREGLGGAILTVLAILYAFVLPSIDELRQVLTGGNPRPALSQKRPDRKLATAVGTGHGPAESMADTLSASRLAPWVLEAQSLKRGPTDEFQLLRAEVSDLVLAGEWQKAREKLEKLIERYPQTTSPRVYFAAADYFCREVDEKNRLRAITLLEQLQSNHPEDELAAYAHLRVAS